MNDITCREFIDFLVDYLDHELPRHRREAFEAHLAACPSCRAYLKNYQETIRLGRTALTQDDTAVPAAVPPELIAAILASLAR